MAGTLFENNLSPYLTVVEQGSTPATPSAGDQRLFIRTSDHLLCYVNSSGTVTPVGGSASGSITTSGYTQNTARLLGRTTASAGAIEEITVGSGLSLSAGSLTATGSSGGALVLLEQHSGSGSEATLDFTTFISSTYDEYLFEVVNLVPVTDSVGFYMRMGTGAGPTWDSGTNYGFFQFTFRAGAYANGGADTGQNAIGLTFNTTISNAATRGVYGQLRLFSPESTALYKQVEGSVSCFASSLRIGNLVDGVYISTTAVTGVRFFFNSGNVSAGTIRAYGIAK